MAAPLNDTIIAIVNSEAITLKDLRDYIGGIYRQLKVENTSKTCAIISAGFTGS
ncbi:MAG: hypothetical protein HYZ86_01360 [Candidatus Omnitrophica bacterium]|nr:hypothetical protein [Candidatus Omnitrophota bacterium]